MSIFFQDAQFSDVILWLLRFQIFFQIILIFFKFHSFLVLFDVKCQLAELSFFWLHNRVAPTPQAYHGPACSIAVFLLMLAVLIVAHTRHKLHRDLAHMANALTTSIPAPGWPRRPWRYEPRPAASLYLGAGCAGCGTQTHPSTFQTQ